MSIIYKNDLKPVNWVYNTPKLLLLKSSKGFQKLANRKLASRKLALKYRKPSFSVPWGISGYCGIQLVTQDGSLCEQNFISIFKGKESSKNVFTFMTHP